MKWFTAANENSIRKDEFFNLLRVAVVSAKKNTGLQPCLIFDGDDCDRLEWFRQHGVLVFFRKVPFFDRLEEYVLEHFDQEHLDIRSGAFLRMEIPNLLSESGYHDEFVLYTDCDIVFTNRCELNNVRPKKFAAAGRKSGGYSRFHIFGKWHFNSGVMVMNVGELRSDYKSFQAFILSNGAGVDRPDSPFMKKNLFMSDQVALNLYFDGKIAHLDRTYNWHPTDGINYRAKIIHFNGLKWTQWDEFLNKTIRADWQPKYEKLVAKDRKSYEYYVKVAQEYFDIVSESRGD